MVERPFTLRLVRLASDRSGQDLVEYAILCGCLAFAAVAAVPQLGVPITNLLTAVTEVLAALA